MKEAGLSVTASLAAISTRLASAAALAKAALVCAQSGSERGAVRIVLDLGELPSEDTTLHGAIGLIGRLNRKAEAAHPPDE